MPLTPTVHPTVDEINFTLVRLLSVGKGFCKNHCALEILQTIIKMISVISRFI